MLSLYKSFTMSAQDSRTIPSQDITYQTSCSYLLPVIARLFTWEAKCGKRRSDRRRSCYYVHAVTTAEKVSDPQAIPDSGSDFSGSGFTIQKKRRRPSNLAAWAVVGSQT